jgi:hypothetical protein
MISDRVAGNDLHLLIWLFSQSSHEESVAVQLFGMKVAMLLIQHNLQLQEICPLTGIALSLLKSSGWM